MATKDKPTQQTNPGAAVAAGFMAAPQPIPPPPVDHEMTEAELNAMSLAQLADMIAANTTAYDGLTLTNRNALVRLLRATTEA